MTIWTPTGKAKGLHKRKSKDPLSRDKLKSTTKTKVAAQLARTGERQEQRAKSARARLARQVAELEKKLEPTPTNRRRIERANAPALSPRESSSGKLVEIIRLAKNSSEARPAIAGEDEPSRPVARPRDIDERALSHDC